ncbi:MAG: DUF3052 family protein [Anaerolineales bacterium]
MGSSSAERGGRGQAGYSTRTLPAKLGLKSGDRVTILYAPEGYQATLGELPPQVKILTGRASQLDFIQLFARSRTDLEQDFAKAAARLKPDGMLWISWPKQSSPLAGELNENIVREVGLSVGLVDVKVAAIDDDWSGLKFVYRLKDRSSS